MLTPDKFAVNEVWVVGKLNAAPVALAEGPCNVFGLMDAGSTYAIGRPFVVRVGSAPDDSEVDSVFRLAREMTHSWPVRILLEDSVPQGSGFERVARGKGIAVEYAPASELVEILRGLREMIAVNAGG